MDEALWALGRGTGVVALVLLTLSVVLGITVRSGRPAAGIPRFGLVVVHRNATLLACVFTLVHVVSLFFDPYAQLNLLDAVLPFLGEYRPFWLGLGTLAVDLMLAVTMTALLRRRVGLRVFRAVHWASYALWPIAFAHSLGTGTDALTPWFLVLAIACAVAVVAAVGWRVTRRFGRPVVPSPIRPLPEGASR